MVMSCCVLLLVCLLSVASAAPSNVNAPLYVASFNIQNLGNSKLGNNNVMPIVRKIISRYDLILIEEIATKNQDLVEKMVDDINRLEPADSKYAIAISERLGSTNNKEQYAYIYRTDKLELLNQEVYPDKTNEHFERPPFIAQFKSPTTRDFTSFVVAGIHTQPTKTVGEISDLATVYDYIIKKYKTKDVILMGDMNAGCSYVPIKEWINIQLYTRTEFNWLISHDVDTTNAISSCPYDRFVIAGENLNRGVIPGSAHAFDYMTEYHLSDAEANAVSDHKVIEVKFRGQASPAVSKNIDTHSCIEVQDLRTVGKLQASVKKASNIKSLDSTTSKTVWIASSTSKTLDGIFATLEELKKSMPDVFTNEVMDSIRYKVENGALTDLTSFVPKPDAQFLLTVECDITKSVCKTKICHETNVN